MSADSRRNSSESGQRTLAIAVTVVAVVAGAALMWLLFDVVLLVFGSILLAILLRTPADWLDRHLPVGPRLSLALVILAIVATLATLGWLFGRALGEQLSQLTQQLPEMVERVRERLVQYDWLVDVISPGQVMEGGGQLLGTGIDVIVASFGMIGGAAVLLLVGVFLAIEPESYRSGFLRLVPVHKRPKIDATLTATGEILQRWLLGQLFLMTCIGVLTGIGLKLLGVPLSFALGVVTGLLAFIPFLGPILAAIPAVLIGLSVSPMVAGYVLLLYIVVQAIEGNLLEPLVHRRSVRLGPALLLVGQVVFGVLAGPLGVILATPLTAALAVVLQKHYVDDVPGNESGSARVKTQGAKK